jgi:hypothetical protein
MMKHFTDANDKRRWESVHICPRCAFVINLSEIDLRTITTGIVECVRCQWSGPIEIQIVQVAEGSDHPDAN